METCFNTKPTPISNYNKHCFRLSDIFMGVPVNVFVIDMIKVKDFDLLSHSTLIDEL